jgi:hypothetical protein
MKRVSTYECAGCTAVSGVQFCAPCVGPSAQIDQRLGVRRSEDPVFCDGCGDGGIAGAPS